MVAQVKRFGTLVTIINKITTIKMSPIGMFGDTDLGILHFGALHLLGEVGLVSGGDHLRCHLDAERASAFLNLGLDGFASLIQKL